MICAVNVGPAAGTWNFQPPDGQTIDCPHCGQATMLAEAPAAPPAAGRRLMLVGIFVTMVVILNVLAAIWFLFLGGEAAKPMATPAVALTVKPTNAVVVADQLKPGETLTNDLVVTAGQLVPTPGSSLVYVTGQVRNQASRQRFGVKIRFDLLDADGQVIGQATDYQGTFDPHGEWQYKAMVMVPKVAAVRWAGIAEEK